MFSMPIVGIGEKERKYLDAIYFRHSVETPVQKIGLLQQLTGYNQCTAIDATGQLLGLELALISDELS